MSRSFDGVIDSFVGMGFESSVVIVTSLYGSTWISSSGGGFACSFLVAFLSLSLTVHDQNTSTSTLTMTAYFLIPID
jgi:hypothetical protein